MPSSLLPRSKDGRDPRELAAMDMDRHLADRKLKTRYIGTMFDILAPGYDAFTRIFSFGMDRGWKDRIVQQAAARATKQPVILDLACGTGNLGLGLARALHAPLALGLDLSPRMLIETQSRLKREGGNFPMAACDMQDLCLPNRSVDVVSVGYGFRNTSDAPACIREAARVLRPGGLLLVLDFYKPVSAVWRELFLFYILNAGRLAGWLWHREPVTYGYVATSIRRYLTMPEFETELVRAGFVVEWRSSHLGGAIGLHAARLAPLQ